MEIYKTCRRCGAEKPLKGFISLCATYKGRPIVRHSSVCRCCIHRKYVANELRITRGVALEDLGFVSELMYRGWSIKISGVIPLPLQSFHRLFYKNKGRVAVKEVRLTKVNMGEWIVSPVYEKGYTGKSLTLSTERFFELLNQGEDDE